MSTGADQLNETGSGGETPSDPPAARSEFAENLAGTTPAAHLPDAAARDEERLPSLARRAGVNAMPDGQPTAAEGQRSGAPHTQAAPGDDPAPDAFLGLTRGDRWFVLVCVTVILALMLVHWVRLAARGVAPIEIDRLGDKPYQFQIDINRATWVEWMQLEGIGETLARRIVEDREQRGPFGSVDDVNRVKGIGDKTLAAIRPFLRCRDCPEEPGSPP